ncbi:hypothetical protein ACLOJK_012399 [Asimina triloba]
MDPPPISLLACCRFLLLSVTFLSSTPFLHLASAASSSNETDRDALLRFKAEITDPLHSLSSWNETIHFCRWQGVTCSRLHRQRVTAVDLAGYSLAGVIPPHIANLTFLRLIDLSNNMLRGAIIPEIGRLRRLQYLFLGNNTLSGDIPANLTQCSELTKLYLSRNTLVGTIPPGLGSLSKLTRLILGFNNLTGRIPPSLGNLSSLSYLHLSVNGLVGSIPAELGKMKSLVWFAVATNALSGTIPPPLYNISSLQHFEVIINGFSGELPSDLGLKLPNLQWLGMAINQFTGTIPVSLSNATALEVVVLDYNLFTGSVTTNLGRLGSLKRLTFANNQLGSSGKGQDLVFLDSLTNCSALNVLNMNQNNLSGILPESMGNLSAQLQWLQMRDNKISGRIPSGISNLAGLAVLDMGRNLLTGAIPIGIGKLSNVAELYFTGNQLSGEIPASICNMTQLYLLVLFESNLEGSIPSCLGNCRRLQFLYLYSNLKALQGLDVSNNNFSGEIPASIGGGLSLEILSLNDNSFQGSIPSTISSLRGLSFLDLSRNNLSGNIPEFPGTLLLTQLNLSFNNFEGELPRKGFFGNASAVSVLGNSRLCGGIQQFHLPACIQRASSKSRISHATKVKIIIAVVIPGIAALSFLLFSLLWLRNSRTISSSTSSNLEHPFKDVSYAELLRITNGFSSANLIGTGSHGSVYKGLMSRVDSDVAVKVINLLQEGAFESFVAECEALRNIRHRNLVKVLTCCSSLDFKGNEFKALIYEYMPNGNLRKWLHEHGNGYGCSLNLIRRLNIAIDVAAALHYLHHHCQPPIVHRDLKPSNVLLDADMVARVGDFGLAKFVSAVAYSSSIGMKGTIGYVAPGTASQKGDVYSYGILLLEMITGKEPTDYMFEESLNLHRFVKCALPDRVTEIADPYILLEGVEDSQSDKSRMNFRNKMSDCLGSMARIGIVCSAESPRERMEMNEVVSQMHVIRNCLLGVTKER